MDDPSKEKKQRLQQEKKNKKIKSKRDKKPIIVALILTISMLMSAMALYSSMGESPHLEYADGIDGQTSLIITGVLYGTHACEEGGFSIQSGIDDDGDGDDAICLIGDSATYGQELYVFSHGEITGDWIVIY